MGSKRCNHTFFEGMILLICIAYYALYRIRHPNHLSCVNYKTLPSPSWPSSLTPFFWGNEVETALPSLTWSVVISQFLFACQMQGILTWWLTSQSWSSVSERYWKTWALILLVFLIWFHNRQPKNCPLSRVHGIMLYVVSYIIGNLHHMEIVNFHINEKYILNRHLMYLILF